MRISSLFAPLNKLVALFIVLILFHSGAVAQDEKTATISDSVSVDDTVFSKVEVEAAFPGGIEGWRTFLMNNLKANVPVKNKAPLGIYMVIVVFIVGKDGSISDIKALTNHGYGMEKEVIRIIKKSPKWLPAIQYGRKVNAYRKQPVNFQVVEE
jgi:protein TonB